MLKQGPTEDITCSNWYQVRAQVRKDKFHSIPSTRESIRELYRLHHFQSEPEHLGFIDSHLANNKYLFPVAERVEDGVSGPNPMHRVSKSANEWPASALLPGGSNPRVYQIQIVSLGS